MPKIRNNNDILLYIIGVLPCIWIAILIAPLIKGGLPQIIQEFPIVIENPFKIQWTADSIKTICFFIGGYLLIIGYYISTKKNYRRNEEYGSAKWGSIRKTKKKYKQKPENMNKVLTQHIQMGLNGRLHRRNNHILVTGGSGAGKTRFFSQPNILQCNCSYFVLDPKGENLRATGHLLEEKGYKVKVLDLINMEKSHCYNPFSYLKTDNDVQKLVTNLFKATTPKGSNSSDPFWDTSASMLLMALVFYLVYEAPDYEKNFTMVMELLRAGEVKEDDEEYLSTLDILFHRLEERDSDHIAIKYYKDYRSGAAKTLKSIHITLSTRLEKFNLRGLASLTNTDELELETLGEQKVALFAIIPDNDASFNFIVTMLYTQLFQMLFYIADYKYNGSLPVHVHLIMDEFANVSLPDDFEKILSVSRSRQISMSIIIQNLVQLKALFEKNWESIIGNCDSFLYLGGNEQSSHKFVSEFMGKESIFLNTYGKSTGHSGSYSTNYQLSGRELLTPDEIRMLDNDYSILLIRGERPIYDLKYDIIKHKNIKYTPHGGGKEYYHGGTENAVASITIDPNIENYEFSDFDNEVEYEVLTSEEIEKIL